MTLLYRFSIYNNNIYKNNCPDSLTTNHSNYCGRPLTSRGCVGLGTKIRTKKEFWKFETERFKIRVNSLNDHALYFSNR